MHTSTVVHDIYRIYLPQSVSELHPFAHCTRPGLWSLGQVGAIINRTHLSLVS